MAVYRFKLTLFVSFLFCATTLAQTNKSLDQQISIASTSVRLDSLFRIISRQTRFIFSYNTRKINHSIPFFFSNKHYSLEELLTKIKEKTGLDYSIADNHIILKSARLQASPSKAPNEVIVATKKEQSVTNSKAVPLQNPPKIDSSKKEIIKPLDIPTSINSEQTHPKNESLTEKVIPTNSPEKKDSLMNTGPKNLPVQDQAVTVKVQQPKKDSLQKKRVVQGKPIVKQKIKQYAALNLRTGICADETFYLGPTLQIGIPAIYGTVSYKTDLKIGLVNWGLGTSLKLGKNTNFNLMLTAGNISKHYDSVSVTTYDTGTYHPGIAFRGVNAQSNLTKIVLLIEKKVSSRFIFQAGLVYNLLTTKYSEPPSTENGKNLGAIKPPYLISNSTNTRGDSNVKSWIGAQLNLLYIINFSKGR